MWMHAEIQVLLVILLCSQLIYLVFGKHVPPSDEDKAKWDEEITASLQKNIFKSCSYADISSAAGGNGVDKGSADFHVVRMYPSNKEVEAFSDAPLTKTKANTGFYAAASKRNYNFRKWGAEKIARWEIPQDHPGQNRAQCINATSIASDGQTHSFYNDLKTIRKAFYMVRGHDAYIHPSGMVGKSCGYYQAVESCENRWDRTPNWWHKCNSYLKKENLPWSSLWHQDATTSQKTLEVLTACGDDSELAQKNNISIVPQQHDTVFVMPSLWDFNWHHWIADSMGRVVRSLKLLRKHTNVKIHIREFERYDVDPFREAEFKQAAAKMRNNVFQLLGIDPARVVSGPVLAKTVYIPRPMHCSYALYNPMEIRKLAKEMLYAAHRQMSIQGDPHAFSEDLLLQSTGKSAKPKKIDSSALHDTSTNTVAVMQRFTEFSSNDRDWNNNTFLSVVNAFKAEFQEDFEFVEMRSSDFSKADYCLACDILKFSKSNVLVGAHGAGLTNMMFMPPGSLIVELVGEFKDVNMPVCGYYGPMAVIMGHHHYLYAYDHFGGEQFRPDVAAKEAYAFYQELV